eukprot:1480881-Prorocentrum_lima.AAC.1
MPHPAFLVHPGTQQPTWPAMLGIATVPCTVPRFTLRGGQPATLGVAAVTPALPPGFCSKAARENNHMPATHGIAT